MRNRNRPWIALACGMLVALVMTLAAGGAAAQTIDDLAPLGGGSDPTGGDPNQVVVDRAIGAGIHVMIVYWVRGDTIKIIQQIWYVDLDGDGQFSRGDRVMAVRGG